MTATPSCAPVIAAQRRRTQAVDAGGTQDGRVIATSRSRRSRAAVGERWRPDRDVQIDHGTPLKTAR